MNLRKISVFLLSVFCVITSLNIPIYAEENPTEVVDTPVVETVEQPTVEETAAPESTPATEITYVEEKEEIESETPLEKVEEVVEVEEFKTQFASNISGKDEALLDGLDFSSKRLLLAGENIQFTEDTTILSQFEDLTLVQFETEVEAKNAYLYYLDTADFVEPDVAVQATEGEDVEKNIEMTETNPLDELKEVISESPKEEKEVTIALLDSGANENVIASYSVIGDDTKDDNGHGTQMVSNILSEDSNAKIISIKVLDKDGVGSVSTVVAGIRLAIEQKVNIINLSLVAPKTQENSILKDAIQEAIDAGILVVASAGNNSKNAKYYLPSSISDVMVVGAMLPNKEKLSSSNFGKLVDFMVVANSTSEAASKMSGILSRKLKANEVGFNDSMPENVAFNTFFGSSEELDAPEEFDTSNFTAATNRIINTQELLKQNPGKVMKFLDSVKLGEGVKKDEPVYFYGVNVPKDQEFTNDNLVFNPKPGASGTGTWDGISKNPYANEGNNVNTSRKGFGALSIGDNDRIVVWAPNAGTYNGQPFGAKITYTRVIKGDPRGNYFEIGHGHFKGIWSVWTENAKLMNVKIELFSSVPANSTKPAGNKIFMTNGTKDNSTYMFWGGGGLTNEQAYKADRSQLEPWENPNQNTIETMAIPSSSQDQLYTWDNVDKYKIDKNEIAGYDLAYYEEFKNNANLLVNSHNKDYAEFNVAIKGSLNPGADWRGSGDGSIHWGILNNPVQAVTGFKPDAGGQPMPVLRKYIIVSDNGQEFEYGDRYEAVTENIQNVKYRLLVEMPKKADNLGYVSFEVKDILDPIVSITDINAVEIKFKGQDIKNLFDVSFNEDTREFKATFNRPNDSGIEEDIYEGNLEIFIPISKPLFSEMTDTQKTIWKARENRDIDNEFSIIVEYLFINNRGVIIVNKTPHVSKSNIVKLITPQGLIVKYVDKETGQEIKTPLKDPNKRGDDPYLVEYPTIQGYKVDKDNVNNGTMPNDLHEHIIYYKQSRLIINYLEEGTNIVLHSKYVDLTKEKGDNYNVPSPNIDGYKLVNSADKEVIGVMPSDKHEIDVFYNKTPQVGSQVTTYKTANPAPLSIVQKGQEIEYILTVENTGVKTEEIVNVWDKIPSGTSYVEGSANENGVLENNTVKWTFNNFAPGATKEFRFKVTVNQDNESAIYNSGNWNTGTDETPRETNVTVHPMKDDEQGPATLISKKGGNANTIERYWVDDGSAPIKPLTLAYSGKEVEYTVPASGVYAVTAIGANGGEDGGVLGGMGTQLTALVKLEKGQVLYINVGGAGENARSAGRSFGGYNGGGDAGASNMSGGGGGATSVALVSGTLPTLENNKDQILLVAAGGGGASRDGTVNNADGPQSGGGVFGQGGTHNEDGGGGGGGYIAGKASDFSAGDISGFGGKSYVKPDVVTETSRSNVRSNGQFGLTYVSEWNFGFKAGEQSFTAPVTGIYEYELLGGGGGSAGGNAGRPGRKMIGKIRLTEGETIYIHTGGKGADNVPSAVGGYNGGGAGSPGGNFGGGGGATSISTQSGLLKDIDRSSILLIAGGAGGSGTSMIGEFGAVTTTTVGQDGAANGPKNYGGGGGAGNYGGATNNNGESGNYGQSFIHNSRVTENTYSFGQGSTNGSARLKLLEVTSGHWEYRPKAGANNSNGVISVDENNDTTLTYTINIANTGAATSKDTVIFDNIPVGTEYVPNSAKRVNPEDNNQVISDASYSAERNRVELYIGDLASGETATLLFKVKPTGDVAIIQNSADYGNGIPENEIPNATPPHKTNIVEHRIPGKISVVKVWENDTPENRPENITVKLVGSNATEFEAQLNAANSWKHIFKNIPFGDAAPGVTYTIYELPVDGYESNATQAQPIQVGDTGVVEIRNTRQFYTITTEVVNGTISEKMTEIPAGEDREATYNPNDGHYLSYIEVDGNRIPDTDLENVISNYPFRNVQADHHIRVVYLPYYRITTEVINGTIDPSIENIKEGEDREISYNPNPNHILDYIEIDGNIVPNTPDNLERTSFTNITENHHIKVVYSPAPKIVKNLVTNSQLVKEADLPSQYKSHKFSENENYNDKLHFVNGQAKYEIVIENTLNSDQNFYVFDKLDSNMRFISATDGGVYNDQTQKVEWTDFVLGAKKTHKFYVTVEFEAIGEVRNQVGYTINGFTSEPFDRPTNVIPKPVKTVESVEETPVDLNGKLVAVNEVVMYSISWTNTSNENKEYVIEDKLHDRLEVVEVLNGGNVVTENGTNTVKWTGTAQPQETVKVQFKAKITAPETEVVNDAALLVDELVIGSNPVRNVTPTEPRKDLRIENYSYNHRWLTSGIEADYVITVNNPNNVAEVVSITDEIHSALEIISVSDNGVQDGQNVSWTNVQLGAEETKEFTIKVRVKEDVNGELITNTATVTIGRIPPTPTNNTENPTPMKPVKSVVNRIGADVNTRVVLHKDVLTYIITASNPSNQIIDVTLTDVLSEHLEFVEVLTGDSHVYDEDTRTLTIEKALDPKTDFEFKFNVKTIGQDATIPNKGTVTYRPRLEDPFGVPPGHPDRPNIPWDGVTIPPIDTNTVTVFVPKEPEKRVLDNQLNDINGQYVKDGDVLTYEIEVKNSAATTSDMTVTDRLPKGTKLVEIFDDGAVNEETGLIEWKFELAGYATKTVKFKVEVETQKDDQGFILTEPIKNTGHLIYNDYQIIMNTNPVNNPKLQPTKDVFRPSNPTVSINGEKVKLNEELLYTIHIFNSKEEPVKVKVTDTLDARLQFISASDLGKVITREVEVPVAQPPVVVKPLNGGTVADAPKTMKVTQNILTWDEISLEPGEAKLLTYTVKVANWIDGQVDNTATLIDIANGYSSDTKVVSNPLTKEPVKQVLDNNGKDIHTQLVKEGDTLNYVITFYNDEKVDRHVRVYDRIPVGTSFISAENGGTLVNGEVRWEMLVKAQTTQVVKFKVKVDAYKQDLIENTAELEWEVIPPATPNKPNEPGKPTDPTGPNVPTDPNKPGTNEPNKPKTPTYGKREKTNKVYNRINKPPVIDVETGLDSDKAYIYIGVGFLVCAAVVAYVAVDKMKRDKGAK